MNDVNDLPAVSEDDVLAGQKLVTVELRNGKTREIRVKALPWRTVLLTGAMFSTGDAGAGMIKVLQNALDAADLKDERMDEIVPSDLLRLANVANLLSNGVSAAKKLMAKSAPASAITSPPSAS